MATRQKARYGAYLTGQSLRLYLPTALWLAAALTPWLEPETRLLCLGLFLTSLRARKRATWLRALAYFRFHPQVYLDIAGALLDRCPSGTCGRVLDIGTGGGLMAVETARRFTDIRVTGVDTWQAGFFRLTPARCAANAKAEGVGDRVEFTPGSATQLPFEDATFDLVLSNSVFHLASPDPRGPLAEALRVLKPGGFFVFNDVFAIRSHYGHWDDLMGHLKSLGCRDLQAIELDRAFDVPNAIRCATIGNWILSGRKSADPGNGEET